MKNTNLLSALSLKEVNKGTRYEVFRVNQFFSRHRVEYCTRNANYTVNGKNTSLSLTSFLRKAKPFLPINYYSLPQWTVRFTTVDCIVHYNGLYSLPWETVVVNRKKSLSYP